MKKILRYIFIVIVAALLPVLYTRPAVAQLPTATVSVYPTSQTVAIVNSTATVQIRVANAQNMGGFELTVAYNPSSLVVGDASSISLGPFLASTGRTASMLPPVINNTAGTVKVGAFSFGSAQGPSASGTLVSIDFIVRGTSNLSLQNITLSTADTDPQQQPSTAQNGSITLLGVPVPTPSPSPITSPLPSASPLPSVSPGSQLILQVKFEGTSGDRGTQLVSLNFKDSTTGVSSHQGSHNFDYDAGTTSYVNLSDPVIGVSPGTYDIEVKGPRHITRRFPGRVITSQDAYIDLTSPLLFGGDAHPNDKIDIDDYTILVRDFGPRYPTSGSTGDLDLDDDIDIYDYAIIVKNFVIMNHMKSLPALYIIIIAAVLGIGTVLLLKDASQKQPKPTTQIELKKAEVTLTLSPEDTEIGVGEETTYAVSVQAGENAVAGVETNFTYDPTLISILDIEPGPYLEEPVVLSQTVDEERGKISYALGTLNYGHGEGNTFTIKVRALAPTESLQNLLSFERESTKVGLISEADNSTFAESETVILFQEQPLTIL